MNEKPIGTGPYRVVEHALGKYMRLERNPDYFKDSPKPQPKIDRVDIRFIPDRQTQVAEMLAGGLDLIMNVGADQAKHAQPLPRLQFVSGETRRYVYLQMNTLENTPAPATARHPRAAGDHARDRPRTPWSSRSWVKARSVLHTAVLPGAVRLHRRGSAALCLRSGQGQAAAGGGRIAQRL